MSTKKFLKEYINTPSPVGYEMLLGGQKVWIEEAKKYCTRVETDNYGNAYAYYENFSDDINDKIKISGEKTSIKNVVLDAHADEIGFFVFDITDSGYIKVGRLGGSDINITGSSRVNIWGEKGAVKGVFGHPAIHIQESGYKPKLESIFIDIGASSKEDVVKRGITVGNPITMSDGFMELGDFYCGRALDDKIGGFITINVLKELHENNIKLPFRLIVANAVQEEVGLFGAKMVANNIKPDIAIAIDVTHDTNSPCYNKSKQGSVSSSKGPTICNAPSIQKNLLKFLIDTAKKEKIPYQLEGRGRGSGTNADSYAYPHGINTALIGIPLKYMHTTVETVHKDDVKNSVKLLTSALSDNRMVESFKYDV